MKRKSKFVQFRAPEPMFDAIETTRRELNYPDKSTYIREVLHNDLYKRRRKTI